MQRILWWLQDLLRSMRADGTPLRNPNGPSAQDIRRASQIVRREVRDMGRVAESITQRFKADGVQRVDCFDGKVSAAIVFFETREKAKAARAAGVQERIEARFKKELIHQRRWVAGESKIEVQFDSHENVVENFEGCYWKRLH